MKIPTALIIGITLTVLTGCIAGGDSASGSSSANATLNAMSVTTPHGAVDGSGNRLIRSDLDGGAFTVAWTSNWSSPSATAAFEFYLSPDLVADNSERVFGRTCGNLSLYTCNQSGSVSCSVDGTGVIRCTLSGSTVTTYDASGLIGTAGATLNAIGRVCIYDETLAYRCNSRTATVRIDPAL